MPTVTNPECPPTMQGEIKQLPHHGNKKADTTHISSQNMANKITNKPSKGTNSKDSNIKDCKGQHSSVSRPGWTEKTEEPQEHKCHEEILSVHIDDTQKSTYNAKVSGTEATALFDSGTTLSCISKHFYDRIHRVKPSMVIDTNAGPAIIVTSASDDKLINLGRCRLCIKLGEKMFEYYFQILKNLKRDLILDLNFQRTFKILQDITDDNDLYLHIKKKDCYIQPTGKEHYKSYQYTRVYTNKATKL